MFAPATVRTRKIENGISGCFARASMSDERDQQHGRGDEPHDRPARAPAVVGRLRDRVDEQREPGGDRRRRRRRPARSGAPSGSRARTAARAANTSDADRHVDEEDPLPAEVLRQHAAGEHADRGAGAAHRAPDAERLVALGALLEGRHDDRERGRRDDRGAEALHGARGDQHAFEGGEPAERARRR